MSFGLLGLFLEDFLFNHWLWPDDVIAITACGVAALLLLALGFRRVLDALLALRRDVFLGALALAAAALSFVYVQHFLRGGPRIVDATSYYLQARALSEGYFAWPLELPTASYRGRFLLEHDGHLGGIFPPGYPLILAIGFLIGAPMAIGPVLAAGHVVASYALAREIVSFAPTSIREAVGRGAALLSVFSAGLRYHTADTMSHGATGLAVTLAIFLALRGHRTANPRDFIGVGLLVGAITSMRLVSSFSIGAVTLLLAALPALRIQNLARFGLGLLPGLLLLGLSQWAVTGSPFQSTQLLYYAVSDGPPGCFRYGFGQGIGCVFEHGDFVANRLQQGHTLREAIETSVFRVKFHLADALNVELLTVFVLPVLLVRSVRRLSSGLCVALIAGQIVAYLPFYFDGSYPGGGGRFYADLLGVELALVAALFAARDRPLFTLRGVLVVAALMLLGFATRSIAEHRSLRDRNGGLPGFLPSLAPEVGLLFVDSDAAFNLAFKPRPEALSVARYRGDAHDRFLWNKLGRPASFRYHWQDGKPLVTPYVPADSFRFESEADWPVLAQAGGYAVPVWPACASAGRAVRLLAVQGQATASIELPIAATGLYSVTPQVVDGVAGAFGVLELRDAEGALKARWDWLDRGELSCRALEAQRVSLTAGAARLTLVATKEASLDAVDAVLLPEVVAPVEPSRQQ